ncbi:MAG: RluA family pseudouridine synthase, partial [Anaerolineae bacterium]|nr:RluA family pseudouridine synthase [Anaerolineae bacterium]
EVHLTAEMLAAVEANAALQPEPLPLHILYNDGQIVAIDKPAGIVVHPAAGNTSGTLVNALLAHFPQVASVGGENRAGIVHRLDKDTSGVILVALSEPARLHLMSQFAARTVRKRYLALVDGAPNTLSGIINAPIGRDPMQRKRMAVLPVNRGGREAVSHFRVLERFAQHTLLEVLPQTGRTHQIRVHLAFIGCPIVGDAVYGRRKQTLKLSRHFLHAESLTFRNMAGEAVHVQALLPPELERVLLKLRAQA